MDETEQPPTTGEKVKAAGQLAGLVGVAAVGLGAAIIVGGLLVLLLLILGAVIWGAWSISWVIGLPVTVVIVYVLIRMWTGESV
ncbi:hypothetical protein ASD97_24750 [Streptomyces sp. Root63]|uniref:hypothetical protein n=1 Tax=unclassified Streptomyces TaxID=2593676 RepID=UPI0006F977C8|nr:MULTISPECIES: hypothetical protein [unclassified Streptomyces]KQX27514.1 hypothetical protein ASD29_29980 [Streptomyces sp. Root1295]KRA34754.1 hypothetical protein ASD97_24750 [Streptomyces sp. Root63]